LIKPEAIARNMGLNIIERTIDPFGSVFGQLHFCAHKASFYDPKKRMMVEEYISENTIVIDPNAFAPGCHGAMNNTIAHECVHFALHRKCFEFERLMNPELTSFSCKTVGGIKEEEADALDLMEWQANAIAPRILMPKELFKAKVDELITVKIHEKSASCVIDIMEEVIESLSVVFHVSRVAAKIRCMEIGYSEAIGCFNYIDGRYIKPYIQMNLETGISYSIGKTDSAILLATDPAFAEKVRNENYLYIDGHYIHNDPKYVIINSSGRHDITDVARYHIEECAIAFSVQIIRSLSTPSAQYWRICILNREKNTPYRLVFQYNKELTRASEEERKEAIVGYLNESHQLLKEMSLDYVSSIARAREWSGFTREMIAENADMDVRTLDRVLTGEVKKIETILRALLAMKLPPEVIKHLLKISPNGWSFTDQKNIAYNWAIDSFVGYDAEEIFQKLQEIGYPPY